MAARDRCRPRPHPAGSGRRKAPAVLLLAIRASTPIHEIVEATVFDDMRAHSLAVHKNAPKEGDPVVLELHRINRVHVLYSQTDASAMVNSLQTKLPQSFCILPGRVFSPQHATQWWAEAHPPVALKDRVRASERRRENKGGVRLPGGFLTPEAAEALDRLIASGFAENKAEAISKALVATAKGPQS